MNKKDIANRILQNGKPLSQHKFKWDNKKREIQTNENDLVFNFYEIGYITFNTGSDCTFNTGSNCTFDTTSNCTFKTGNNCTFKTASDCTFNTYYDCTFKTGNNCTFKTTSNCIFNTASNCTFKTASNCTFDTTSNCTFDTYYDCTFKTTSDCTFNTGSDCTFNTGSDCTFDTGSNCKFINTPKNILIKNQFVDIIPDIGYDIHISPNNIKGYLYRKHGDNKYYMDTPEGKFEHIIADGILSKVINTKGSVRKVINYGEKHESFLIENDGIFSHGKTIKEARESLIYKLIKRDISCYDDYNLDTVITYQEAITLYRSITGACESGVKYFIKNNPDVVKEKYTINEIIELTDGQYNNNKLVEFFNKKS
jgi:hypothetical protein